MNSLEFNGNGTEYFKIWIVNILLTIVTLGIYHPWAKVRSRRYFFGNTELDNANFEYHATGKQLFIGFVIAMVLFIAYIVLSSINPILSVALAVIIMLAAPWIIWRSIKFNMRMISYRNVRFGFKGSLGGSYAIFLAYPLGMMIAFGIVMAVVIGILGSVMGMESFASILMGIMLLFAYPAFFAMFNKLTTNYMTNGSHFGQGDFITDLKFGTFFKIMLKGMGLGILLSILAVVAIGTLAYFAIGFEKIAMFGEQMKGMEQGAQPEAMFFAIIGSVYLFMIPVGIYIASYFKARHRTYIFGETTLNNSVNFESTLRANKLFGINITNLLMMIFTAGLAYPWAKVRSYRYLTETINVGTPQGLNGYVSKQGSEGAIGEELSDAFDIDVGGIAF